MRKSIDQNGRPYSRFWFIFTLLIGTFTMSISQSSLSTAYPTLMRAFGISASTVQWLTTGFMLVMCVSMPISPWMLNNLNFKTMFIGALALFDIGSLMIILTPANWGVSGFWFMMIGRAMEAFAVGVLFPSYQSVLLEITPRDARGTTMGIAGLVMGSALACGPIVSGILLKFFTWKSLFIFFMIIITVIIIMAGSGLIRDVMQRHESSLDWLSVFLSIGLIGIMYVIDQFGKAKANWGISGIILIISILAIIWFCVRQLHLKEPLLELRVMKTFNYDLAILLTSISYIALIVTTIIFPLYYQGVLKVSPFVSGMSLVPGAALLSILNPLTGKLADKIGFKPTMLVGMVMIVAGWFAGLFLINRMSLWIMIFCAMVIEGGNAFVMMPAVTLGANSLPNELVPHGTAVITTVRQVLGSTGVAVSTIILTTVTSHNLSRGMGSLSAALNGYHYVFLTMFFVEIIGLFMALALKNTAKKDAKA
ncbi:MFS transporter [Limosilactobacillus fastidiosus]|uniref:MFS transporter n=1 Tax=Limosilactobacillus fastidiosus TaxID=2759855 RepID=A0A7W3U0V0_9LACO|nr:MFS transporter [Limosilactobacillus fastidiosus]MBB1063578.1 MFS transporter [Limosilactobacillus fastidiosus]MBB1086847.1 MFS transporter [Limosilactobacillus fastidiosus]MCD7084154.1 MFS transporter [Limosilactobacillus fastidiosus]MCD7085426.1 MFS transporter [Limosilactobacillus fastidiosus]MCD7114657.1 MFS transporter [Limosilactobacillus fastidiosus]